MDPKSESEPNYNQISIINQFEFHLSINKWLHERTNEPSQGPNEIVSCYHECLVGGVVGGLVAQYSTVHVPSIQRFPIKIHPTQRAIILCDIWPNISESNRKLTDKIWIQLAFNEL